MCQLLIIDGGAGPRYSATDACQHSDQRRPHAHKLADFSVPSLLACSPCGAVELTPKTESILLRCGARFGAIDTRIQAEVFSVRRSDTPKQDAIRIEASILVLAFLLTQTRTPVLPEMDCLELNHLLTNLEHVQQRRKELEGVITQRCRLSEEATLPVSATGGPECRRHHSPVTGQRRAL